MSSDCADFLAEATSRMRADGLLADSIIADGGWHRCAIDSERRNQDGSYKVVNDRWPIAFWANWKHGLQSSFCAKSKQSMTWKERQEFEAELVRIAEEDRKRREAAQANAAKKAAYLWGQAGPATQEHGYLKRKGVNPGPCRLAKSGRLLMPLYDGKGQLMSLQFISPEKRGEYSDKLLLKDGKKQGCYCPLPARPGHEAGPLLIAEGFATAMSLHMATGYEVWIAVDCYNLLEVAKLAMGNHSERARVICGDNDPPHLPNYPKQGGIGAEKGRIAAEKTGAYFALCPVWDGRNKADFNDLACDLGPDRVRQEIEIVLKSRPVTDCIIPDDFILKPEGPEAGLYWLQYLTGGLQPKEIRLGDPLHIHGYTRTKDGDNWGLFLAWKDQDGREHQYALPKSLLTGQRSEWLPLLADMGWTFDSAYKKQIARYLEVSKPIKRIRCVTATGWSGNRYVLPGCIYGNGEDQIVLQATGYKELYQNNGNLEDWQGLAALCVNNPKLGFAVSCAFAGPLLALAGMEGGLFSFEGASSCGKTTALTAAASVWGKPEFHVKKWRATDNSLEVTASLHNDGLLILDELGEADSKKLAETVYMLSGGQGKNRANKDGGLRKTYRWRVLTLSSGELGLADKLLEVGKRTRAGQEARFVAIPVTTTDIANLHGMANSGLLVRQIKKLANTHYGVAGREFLKRLTQEEALQAAKSVLQDGLEDIADSFCPADCDGQVRRVALRFALVSIAGTLARDMGILPADFEAADYARACFREWLEQRGGTGPAEDMAILRQVQLFIEQHGQSRFQDLKNLDVSCLNRAGYREDTTFFCLPEVFKAEIVKGYSAKRAIEVLAKAGLLQKDGGRSTRVIRVPNLGTVRVYKVVLPEEKPDDEAPKSGS